MRSAAALAVAGLLAIAEPPALAGVATDEMHACARLGAKRPGTDAARAEADRIARAFRAAGLDTRLEDFHVPVYDVERVSLRVVGQNARRVPGETFAYGGTGRVEAEVVDVGVGRPGDYAGRDVRGKIVMVRRDEAFHRSSQLTQILARGGAAMLYVSGSPDNLIQTGAVRFAQRMPAPIPTVTVGGAEGAALRQELEQRGLRMAIEVDARRVDRVARNVLGVRRGTTRPDDVIVVGGHYDSWHAGAIDNCTAVGSLLSIVDALKGASLPYTVVFAGWDAEEGGLTGSYDWAMRHPDVLRRVVVNVNLEMTAGPAGALKIRFGTSSPAMNAVATTTSLANGYTPVPLPAVAIRQVSGGIIPTDLQPFYTAGIQGFSTFTSTPYYHTVEDRPERVDADALERVSRFLADATRALAALPPSALRLREVPEVSVTAPEKAPPGAPVDVEVRVRDPLGLPLSGGPVTVLVNQRDHWPRAEGVAEEVGNGVYRYRIPPGATRADRTSITATIDRDAYMGEGYASIDQNRCLPRKLAVSARRIGPARLRHNLDALLRGYTALKRRGRVTRVCLRGRGRFLVVTRRGRIDLVVSTAKGHRTRRVRPGRRLRDGRIQGARRLARGLLVGHQGGRRSRVIYGVRRGRVRFVAVARYRWVQRPRALSRRLRKLGL